MPVERMFNSADTRRMMRHLRAMGAPFGIAFTDIARISNSRLALQAAEFAKKHGGSEELHHALFQAYFSAGMDIGDREVVMQIGTDSGLDVTALELALREGTYLPNLEHARQEAARLAVTGVPTFFLGDNKRLVGAQPLEVFRKALSSLESTGS